MEDIEIDICLAMYNGAEWLEDFLHSIKSQSQLNWRLIVSDDGSTDESVNILKSFFHDDNDKLLIVNRQRFGHGVVANFHDALSASRAEYVFLADQDDVWLPEKLQILCSNIKNLEGKKKSAALVFSDMLVVDANLKTISNSWWHYSKASFQWAFFFKNLLSQNVVPGCSIVINRRLLDIALPIPAGALMHDWWLILVCSIFGVIGYCPEKTLLYRRHIKAATYSNTGGIISGIERFLFQKNLVRKNFMDTVQQASLINSIYGKIMSKSNFDLLNSYIKSAQKNWIFKRWILLRYGIRRATIQGTFRFYFWI